MRSIFRSVAIQVHTRLYVPTPGEYWPHCDLLELMSERDIEYALAHEAECFGFVTAGGEFLNRSEASGLVGLQAESSLMQERGHLVA